MRNRFWLVFVLLINKVFLRITVEQCVGEPAVLPCNYSDNKLLNDQDLRVNWRYRLKKVCDINPGRGPAENHKPECTDNVESFPEMYVKGNFSIKIKKVGYADAGIYSCFITNTQPQIVELLVRDLIEEIRNETRMEQECSRPGRILILVPLFCVFILFSICVLLLVTNVPSRLCKSEDK